MAKFTFGKAVDIHWNGYEIVGPALTEFTIPDQLYEEFEGDFRDVEPSLTWIDTNEFATLSASVSGSTLSATSPISITTTSTGRNISFSSGTALNGYLLAADGSGGSIWNPASTSGISSVVGVSPISSIISGGVVSVSLDTTATLNATNAGTLRTYVKNASGSTITKGSVVYITGADGTNALIGLASNTSDATSSKTLGIVANTMTNNEFGYVIENGQLSNIDTSAATAGSGVWLGSTPGSYQFTVPSEPNHAVYLGVVTKANVSTGEILVKVQNGYEIDELHDVSAATPTDLDILQYKSSSGMWTKSGLTDAGIVTPTGTQTLTNKTLTLPSISNVTGDYATNVQANATTYTLTSTSPRYQFVTGNATGTVIALPSTATLVVGQWFEIHNNGTQNIVVSTSTAASLISTAIGGLSYRVTCISTANNATSAWDVEVIGSGASTGSGNSVFSSSPSISGLTATGNITMSSGGIQGATFIRTAGWTSIATAAGTTSPSTTAYQNIKFTGTNTQFLNLTGVGSSGLEYRILNTSTGDVTVRSSDLSTVVVLKQNQAVRVMLNATNGTTASSWDVQWLGASTATGTGSSVYSASPTFTGDVTLNAQGDIRFADSDSSNWVALQGPATVASNVTWTLPSADGTNGQALTTNGTGTLSWASGGMSLISSATISSGVSTVDKPANAKIAFIRLMSGGNGGNTYATNNSNDIGAAGGSGGGITELWVNANEFTSPISYSVGAGGSGAVAVAYTSATLTTTTTIGTAGGSTTFGPYAATANNFIPGGPNPAGASAAGQNSAGGGGLGGNLNAGGGASGGTNNSAKASGAGGVPLTIKYSTAVAGGGAAAGTESTGSNVSGLNGSNATVAGGGGGAGGSYRGGAVQTANRSSGNGGNGAYPGGGGGAGGAANGGNVSNLSTFTLTAGSGGTGGGGQIYVEWYG